MDGFDVNKIPHDRTSCGLHVRNTTEKCTSHRQ